VDADASHCLVEAFLFPEMKRKDAKTQRREEKASERGCVQSTSRSALLLKECCGWVCDHSRAPLALLLCAVAPLR